MSSITTDSSTDVGKHTGSRPVCSEAHFPMGPGHLRFEDEIPVCLKLLWGACELDGLEAAYIERLACEIALHLCLSPCL